jgi:peptide-methionine (R)-S-oxide reductase
MEKSKQEWKKELPKDVFHVLFEKGTEPPFSGRLYHEKKTGTYHCAACGNLLFSSKDKYESGTGWPSFSGTAHEESVIRKDDHSLGMHRTEVLCKKCGGHLGHVFDDGPKPTGERFCMNSLALSFHESEKNE